jgi:hypothetical protein
MTSYAGIDRIFNEVAKRSKAPVCKSGEHCSTWVRIPSSFPVLGPASSTG